MLRVITAVTRCGYPLTADVAYRAFRGRERKMNQGFLEDHLRTFILFSVITESLCGWKLDFLRLQEFILSLASQGRFSELRSFHSWELYSQDNTFGLVVRFSP
jgi:hypothetical protein